MQAFFLTPNSLYLPAGFAECASAWHLRAHHLPLGQPPPSDAREPPRTGLPAYSWLRKLLFFRGPRRCASFGSRARGGGAPGAPQGQPAGDPRSGRGACHEHGWEAAPSRSAAPSGAHPLCRRPPGRCGGRGQVWAGRGAGGGAGAAGFVCRQPGGAAPRAAAAAAAAAGAAAPR